MKRICETPHYKTLSKRLFLRLCKHAKMAAYFQLINKITGENKYEGGGIPSFFQCPNSMYFSQM